MIKHKPDITKIAKSLAALDWKEMQYDPEWTDGTTLLVARPEFFPENGSLYDYVYHIIHLWADEDPTAEFFHVAFDNDEPIDFSLDECDWVVVISYEILPPF